MKLRAIIVPGFASIHPANIVSMTFAIAFAWFFYSMVLDNVPPVSVEDPVVLNTEPVPRNDVLKVRYHVQVNRSCIGQGQRIVIDAAGTSQSAVPFRTDTAFRSDGQATFIGEAFDEDIEATVPYGSAPGRATYQNQTVFFCNFWQRLLHRGIEVDYPSVGFDVGDNALSRVVPPKTLFKRTESDDLAKWLRHRFVRWVAARGED